MKQFYLSKLAILLTIIAGWSMNAHAQSSSFSYTGGLQTYTVPVGAGSVLVDMAGGQGGIANCSGVGGKGGRVQCVIAATAGQVLNVYVGGAGANYVCCGVNVGGYNGGGNGYEYGGGGGGGTDIRIGGTALANRVAVAGGGGGAGYNWCSEVGGQGGGLTGAIGVPYSGAPSNYSGGGGTQTAGGVGATYSGTSQAGSAGQGGNLSGGFGGGGGGGGYYGGGSGDNYTPGGGGSSYTDPVLATSVTHTQGYNAAAGYVNICPVPNVGVISGNANICPGTTTALSASGVTGGVWSYTSPNILVDAVTGIVTGTAAGTALVTYSKANSCATGSTTYLITINPLPSPITGPLNVCAGAAITLSDPDAGGTWSSATTSLATVGTAGTVSAVAAGVATIDYTLPTGCVRTKAISVNPLPGLFNTTGTGSFCAGSVGLPVGLNGSAVGISYQLYNGASPVAGALLAGTGAALNYGIMSAAGTYTVLATDAVSTCSRTMSGSAVLTANPTPAINTVTGGGNYCAGGTGVTIGLNGSVSGIRYQLYNGAAGVGASVTGGGSTITFGAVTAAGSYTATATNTVTGCSSNMTGSATVGVNPVPAINTITGGGTYCTGGTGVAIGMNGSVSGVNYKLFNGSSFIGSPIPGNGSAISFGSITGAANYTAVAVNSVTACSSNMSGMVTVAISPLPITYNVIGGGPYCTGGNGSDVGLAFSNAGVNYQLMRGGSPVGGPLAGIGAPLDFGLQTTPGVYSVVATNPVTGCTNPMTGSVTVSISPLPTAFTVTLPGGSDYCAGGAGVHVGLSGSTSGVSYQLMMGSTMMGSPVSGTGGTVDFGLQTVAGSYTAVGMNTSTSCSNNMTGSVTVNVNPLPTLYNVTGGGNYCLGGSGVTIGLDGSDFGIQYKLYLAGASVGAPINGNGGALNFGNKTVSGSYTIVATNLATGCTQSMSGSATVTINPLPTVYAVNGGGGYCNGGTGSHVGLAYSNIGINYQLYNGSTPVGGPMAGSGSALDFGPQAAIGTYTVSATNGATTCYNNMSGSVAVSINPLPVTYSVTGGGGFCPGGTGVHVGLSSSNPGIKYWLYNGTTPMGAAVTGTGATIDFGPQTTPGTYTVMASNISTSCSQTMTGSVNVNINAAPAVNTVTGGGSYCASGIGVDVGIDASEIGVDYKLYRGTTWVSTMSGTGLAFSFGNQTVAGSYWVSATNATTGCSSNMSGTALVTIVPNPVVYTVTGGGSYCSGGAGLHVNLSGSTSGISYQLSNSSGPVGAAMSGTGAGVDFGLQTAAGSYTVVATNPVTSCTSNMASSALIVVNMSPGVYAVTGGGSLCAGDAGVPVGLFGSDMGIKYQLYSGSTPIGLAMNGTGSAITFGLKSAAGSYTVVAKDLVSTCTSDMTGSAPVVVNPIVVPTVSIMPSSLNVCAGATVNFNTTASGDGTSPVYQWSVGGTPASTGTSYSYMPANGDMVMVTLTSDALCATPATVSASVVVTVNPLQTPSVTVVSNPGTSICKGTPVLYSANPAYGGSAATYMWYKNSNPVSSGITFADMPSNNDRISVRMYSNYTCRTNDSANSADVTMNVTVPATPTVTIASHPGASIYIGQVDTIVATVANGGTSPAYQWSINNNMVPGATSLTFVHGNYNDGDVVSFDITNSNVCGIQNGSGSVTLHVINNLAVQQITTAGADIKVMPNPSKGEFVIKGTLSNVNDQEVTVEVTNMLGQVVYTGKVAAQNGTINEHISLTNSVTNGMYILNLRSATEQAIVHIVVEK